MLPTPITISPFYPKTASDAEYERLNAFLDVIHKEQLPDDPPIPLEERIQNWKSIPDFVESDVHIAWDPASSAVIGYGEGGVWHTGDNEHVCLLTLYVHPDYRRQGVARMLLERVVAFARKKERSLLITLSQGNVPAGADFLLRLGARRGLETLTNQLRISDLPVDWVEKWVQTGDLLSVRFRMGLWDGPVPEEDLASIVSLEQAVRNDLPRGEMEVENENLTSHMFRETERNLFARGCTRWILYLCDNWTGQFAGLTEVMWTPSRPNIVQQGLTAVLAPYRGQGLGHWLKATMVQKLLHDHPETEVIRTGNANLNEAMLKINTEMGFKPYIARTVWQIERARLEEYLASYRG